MKITIDDRTFATTAREDRGIAFAVAHPGDGPTDRAEIVMSILRERFEEDAVQADAHVENDAVATAATLARYAERSPESAALVRRVIAELVAQPEKEADALVRRVIAELVAQPEKEADALVHMKRTGDALGVERAS